MSAETYRRLADVVLLLHLSIVGFVICGLLLTLVGGAAGWRWVRNPWFRAAHLLAIAVVVAQAWLGVICPLTTLEMAWRQQAGDHVYQGSFVAHWAARLLYWQGPPWVFTVAYSAFGALVLASWWWIRPRRFGADLPANEAAR